MTAKVEVSFNRSLETTFGLDARNAHTVVRPKQERSGVPVSFGAFILPVTDSHDQFLCSCLANYSKKESTVVALSYGNKFRINV